MALERRLHAALTLALSVACDRSSPREPAGKPLPAPAVPEAAVPVQAGCTLAPIPTQLPLAPKRLVAIGDLHGDLAAARAALRAAGAIDDKDAWIGGELVIVQTGDILDRGDDEPNIYELLERLDGEARKAGGAIVMLNGNHELMNGARDFRYVTPEGMNDFGDRQRAFDPGGAWAKKLARYNVVAIVGGAVFSHAGVVADWVTKLDELNLGSRCWLDGQAGGPADPPPALTSQDSPVWTRVYGIPEAVDCAALAATLDKLGAARMVVGHTPQQHGITSACGDKLWRIDVGLSKYYGGPIQVLELVPAPKILTGAR